MRTRGRGVSKILGFVRTSFMYGPYGRSGAGYQLLVGENVGRILSKNQHVLNIFPTCHQHPPNPHILSTTTTAKNNDDNNNNNKKKKKNKQNNKDDDNDDD